MTDMTTPTDPTAALKLAREYRATMPDDVLRAWAADAAAALAAIDALPAPSGEPTDGAIYAAVSEATSPDWHAGFRAGMSAGVACAQAAPAPQAEAVARVVSWTNGSYSRNYRLEWLHDVSEGTELYAAPPPAPAVAAPVQPLTDDRLDELRQAHGGELNFVTLRQFRAVARSVERALGITAPTAPPQETPTAEPTECPACDGDGRVPSKMVCTRCGFAGCWTDECTDCGGTGITAPTAPTGGEG